MKIVHVITSLERGGAQAVLLTIVQALARQRTEQLILYFHNGLYRKQFEDLGITVQKVGLYQLYQQIKKYAPDLIHSVLWLANWASRFIARKRGIPCVISLHNNYDQNGIVRNTLDRINSFAQSTIVAVSDQVKDSFYAYQNTGAAITVIENGIAPITALKKISRKSLGLDQEHFVIGTVGRLVPVKRHLFLLDVFKRVHAFHPEARLLIVGAGPLEENLRKYAQKIGIDDLVVWALDVPATLYYELFDCFVLASLKEGISIALLEAMSSGLPCVVAGQKGYHPVIQDQCNGVVASGQKATCFTRALTDLICNLDLRNKLGTAAQECATERFGNTRMVAAYCDLFYRQLQHWRRNS